MKKRKISLKRAPDGVISDRERQYLICTNVQEPTVTMENSDDIRLIVKIAQLYYEQDMTRRRLPASWGYTAPPSAVC